MLRVFRKIKIDDKNIDDMSAFQSELVKTALNVRSVGELDILVKNMLISLNYHVDSEFCRW